MSLATGQIVTLRTADEYDGRQAEIIRVLSTGQVSVWCDAVSDEPIAVHAYEIEGEPTRRCDHCGELLTESTWLEGRRGVYDWDNPDEDAQGSVMTIETYVICRDRVTCRNNRQVIAAVAAAIAARQADDLAREAGFGAIGGKTR